MLRNSSLPRRKGWSAKGTSVFDLSDFKVFVFHWKNASNESQEIPHSHLDSLVWWLWFSFLPVRFSKIWYLCFVKSTLAHWIVQSYFQSFLVYEWWSRKWEDCSRGKFNRSGFPVIISSIVQIPKTMATSIAVWFIPRWQLILASLHQMTIKKLKQLNNFLWQGWPQRRFFFWRFYHKEPIC